MDFTFIANRLYTLLEQRDITEYELSMQLGRCRSYINKITTCKTLPSMKGFFEICDYFQLTPEEFFSNRDLNDLQTIRQLCEDIKGLSPSSLQLVAELVSRIKDLEQSGKEKRT